MRLIEGGLKLQQDDICQACRHALRIAAIMLSATDPEGKAAELEEALEAAYADRMFENRELFRRAADAAVSAGARRAASILADVISEFDRRDREARISLIK